MLADHPGLSRNDVVRVESQVVAGMNYRFTFRQSNGQDVQYTTYVSLEAMDSINSKTKSTHVQPAATLMRVTTAQDPLAPRPKKMSVTLKKEG